MLTNLPEKKQRNDGWVYANSDTWWIYECVISLWIGVCVWNGNVYDVSNYWTQITLHWERLRLDCAALVLDIGPTLNQHWTRVSPFLNSDMRKPRRLLFAILSPWRGGPRVVVSIAAFHGRVRGSFPGLDGLKETKMFLSHSLVKLSIAGSLGDREVACSASDLQGLNFESCVWRASHSSHQPQDVLLAQFSLYVHKSGLKPIYF